MGHRSDVQVCMREAKDRMGSMEGYHRGYCKVCWQESNVKVVFYWCCIWLQVNWSEWCEQV